MWFSNKASQSKINWKVIRRGDAVYGKDKRVKCVKKHARDEVNSIEGGAAYTFWNAMMWDVHKRQE